MTNDIRIDKRLILLPLLCFTIIIPIYRYAIVYRKIMKTIFVSAYRVPCHAVSKLRNCGCRHENNNNVTAFFEL